MIGVLVESYLVGLARSSDKMSHLLSSHLICKVKLGPRAWQVVEKERSERSGYGRWGSRWTLRHAFCRWVLALWTLESSHYWLC
jgi:hypothetical protein